jgi:hypothetical protein
MLPASSTVPESVRGLGGYCWEELYWGKNFSLTLQVYRWLTTTVPVTEIEQTEVLKIMLRDLVQSRTHNAWSIVSPGFLTTELGRIKEIRANSTPETLRAVCADPNFIAHTQRDSLGNTINLRKINESLDDVQELIKLDNNWLEEEYGKRELERVKKNLTNVVSNLLCITVDSTGYNLSCKVGEVCNETMEAIKDLVWRDIEAGAYKTKSFGRKTRTSISWGRINEIMISEKGGKAYTYPKDKGKEYKLRPK